jgi:signal transduction histidine kinase/DNA-binding response OmpR family regulator
MEIDHLQTEKLEEVDRMKSRFFANISHEFRTPLTLIKGPVKQIISGDFKGNLIEQCKMILRNSDRLLGLINQILDLSKLESGGMKLQVSETDIIRYLKGMVHSFASLAERKKVILQFNITEETMVGFVDRDKLERIVTNLLSNAFKFTPEHGEILVNLTAVIPVPHLAGGIQRGKLQQESLQKKWIPHQVRDDNIGNSQSKMMEITITNTGPGIPPDRLDKIFDRFYQVDDSVTRHQEGTGIGLALTKELVELHHGTINVECANIEKHPPKSPPPVGGSSTLDRGDLFRTTFTILLPIGKKHYSENEIVVETLISKVDDQVSQTVSSIQHRASSIRSVVSGLRSPLVLVVEDNPDVTSYIRSFLDQTYRIITASNGIEGWQQAVKKYPDLIISDVMMPEMDGFEFCKKVKSDERTSHIPVILLTARADMESKIEGLEFGADDYISKPFEADELKVRSKNLIEQRRKLRKKFSRMIEIKPGEVVASSMDEQFLERLLTVFEKHLSESGYSTENFAQEVGMSRSQLNRKLKAITNLPTHKFILNLRLKRAAQLLKRKTGTVSEIADVVGFENPSKFAHAFRTQYGQSPSDFSLKQNR